MTPDSTASSLLGRDGLIIATTVGLILQFLMVVAGHYSAPVKASFAIGGMAFSLLAGLLYVRLAPGGWAGACLGGAIAGGVCAIIGIAVSVSLKDVPTQILWLGTSASVVTGLIGGAIGKVIG
jgi:hypothetical protein